ncbi:monocyte to macrophage differentiation factor-like isoform X2 [Gordionus sp. m RMFG-2023]
MCMILTFIISSLFHYFSYLGNNEKLRSIFHLCDRTIIYIFIAASYTPWLSIPGSDTFTHLMIWSIWIAALSGVAAQFVVNERLLHDYEIILYLMIGVIPAVIIAYYHTDHPGLSQFVKGGLAYVSGIFFFRSDGSIPFAHAIWHLFVIAGVTFHYQAICQLLLAHLGKTF